MMMHEIPGTQWIKTGTVLFKIDDRNYLIIFDYFSRYPVVKELPTTTADRVITSTKETVRIMDVPCEVVSDNMMIFFTVEYQVYNVKSPISPIKWFNRKTDSLHQTIHQEMHRIRRRCQQSVTQRPSDTTGHSVTQTSRTDVSMTNDNTCSMSC